MTLAERIGRLDARPPSIAEWEDLLVRLELMPRALRTTVELGRPDAASEREVLAELIDRESVIGAWLEGLAAGATGDERGSGRDRSAPVEDEERQARIERFGRLRARTFAMVQRRGLEVWEWEGALEPGRVVTVYQALTYLVQEDVRALGRLRSRPIA